jgi:uncharacterized membrane protein (DUF106 family)
MYPNVMELLGKNPELVQDAKTTFSIFILIISALVIALYISILYDGYVSYKKLEEDKVENKLSDSEKKVRRLNYRQSLVLSTILVLYFIAIIVMIRMINKLSK